MLWRFRREIIFVIGLFLSVMIVRHHSHRRVYNIESSQGEEIKTTNYEELIAENIRLKEILDLKKDVSLLKKKVIVGQIVSIKPIIFPAEIIINKGRNNGVREDMAVFSKEMFLIGRITNVYQDSAFVKTVFNTKTKISVIIDTTREIGILEGGSIPLLSLKYIPSDSNVKEGDKVITSGFSDFYPKGIEVGEIVRIEQNTETLFLNILVKPFSCISAIEEVLISE